MASGSTPPNAPLPTADDYKVASEHLWKTYQTINEWIRFADTKAGALLAANGVLIGAAIGKLPNSFPFHSNQWEFWVIVVLSASCGLFLILSAVYSLFCIQPTLENDISTWVQRVQRRLSGSPTTGSSVPKTSLIYFDHIADRRSALVFGQDALKVKSARVAFEEINSQVYEVSRVARKKHRYIGESVVTLAIGLAFGVVLLIVTTVLALSSGGTP